MNATKYEIINKETGVITPVTAWAGGDTGNDTVTVTTELGNIVFPNVDEMGTSENETYAIREIGTHSQPDGTGTIDDMGVPTE